MNWVLWCCTQCKHVRYTTEWWAKLGAPHCHHGKHQGYGEVYGPTIPLDFNPVEQAWYGR
jgi:hypothetical protein